MTRSHFDGRRFRNPGPSASRSFGEVVRWQLTADRRPWPIRVPLTPVAPPPPLVPPGVIAATFVNHATFVLRSASATLVTDPIWSERASPVSFAGPKRVHAPGVSFADVPRVDVVLLSHNHYDHLDRPTLAALDRRDGPTIVTLRGNDRYLSSQGLRRVHALDWWEHVVLGDTRITATPAQHFSGRGLLDRDRALWGGFVVEWDAPTVFVAADSGYWGHFTEVRGRFGRVGLALLPIGAYEPRWFMGPAHMNPADAVQAHLDLDGPPTIGMHFGTFQLTDEGWDDPPRHLAEALAARGVEDSMFRVPRPGETFLGDGAQLVVVGSG